MSINKLQALQAEITNSVNTTGDQLERMRQMFEAMQAEARRAIAKMTPQGWDRESFKTLVEKPYAVRPLGGGEFEIIIPKCTGFRAGWVVSSDDRWLYCRVNRLTSLINPLPAELAQEVNFEAPTFTAQMLGNVLTVTSGNMDEVINRIGGSRVISKRTGNRLIIRPASAVDVVRQIIENEGFIPYTPTPLPRNLLRAPEITRLKDGSPSFALRPQQQRDYERWRDQLGAATLVPYFQTGKSYVALQALAELKGQKFIFCKTKSLIEQWRTRIDLHLTPQAASEVMLITYAAAPKFLKKHKHCSLYVLDEAHHAPSDTMTQVSVEVDAVARLGLTASPMRADGLHTIIPALTGQYLGGDWEIEDVQRPKVTIWIVRSHTQKIAHLKRLAATPVKGKTVVMTFRLEIGKEAARALGNVPFVYGGSHREPLATIQAAPLLVVSKIADEGLSIEDIGRVIEIDSLGGNIESGQRAGRLANTTSRKGEFHIIITPDEIHKTERRMAILEQWRMEIDIRTPDDTGASSSTIQSARLQKRPSAPIRTRRSTAPKPIPSNAPTVNDLLPDDVQAVVDLLAVQARLAKATRSIKDARAIPHLLTVFAACAHRTMDPTQIAESKGQSGRATVYRYNAAAKALVKVGLLREEGTAYSWNDAEIESLKAIS